MLKGTSLGTSTSTGTLTPSEPVLQLTQTHKGPKKPVRAKILKPETQTQEKVEEKIQRKIVKQGFVTRQGSEAQAKWEAMMRKFSDSRKNKDRCRTDINTEKLNLKNMPQVQRDLKTFPTGSSYEGTWDMFGMSGRGIYTLPSGVYYEGEFRDGTFHGKGEMTYPNGAVIRGKWKKGNQVDRKVMFPDGLEYVEWDWRYLKMPDRRFSIEYEEEIQSVDVSFLTAEQPTRDIPPGHYDTGDGFYDPKNYMVFDAERPTVSIRTVQSREHKWIIENCRSSEDDPVGPRPDLYEQWVLPQEEMELPPFPPIPTKSETFQSVRDFVEMESV